MKDELLKKFKRILRPAKKSPVTVVIDWLSVLFMDEKRNIPEPTSDNFTYSVNDQIAIVYTGKGNEHYKHIYNVQYNGQHLATILAHTRNPKFLAEGSVKIDFKNHLLYSVDLWPIYDEIAAAFELTYRNVSRLDIAIDGMNYVLDFLNEYIKQSQGEKAVEMVNRARYNASVLDQKSMKFQSFVFGSKKKSRKKITIYNKSLDIVKTGKDYIQQYWKANGVMRELLPLEMLLKRLKKEHETAIEGYENIYRFEVRLKGEALKEIEGFSLDLLKTPDGLMSIVKLMTDNFFEFRENIYDAKNKNRNERLNVIPFHKFNIQALQKIELQERDDLYKAKLSLNKNVRALYLGKLRPDDFAVHQMMKFDLLSYEQLPKWFKKKLAGEWVKKYVPQNPDTEYTDEVTRFLQELSREVNHEEKAGSVETDKFKPLHFDNEPDKEKTLDSIHGFALGDEKPLEETPF